MKNISIKLKIITLFMVSLILVSVILSVNSINSIKNSMIEKNKDFLQSTMELKKIELEKYFQKVVVDIEILSKSGNTIELMEDLIFVHDKLKIDGSMPFPVKHKLTKEMIEPHEEYYKDFVEKAGYYDAFIICKKHGHVMYSQSKESDYGVNLRDSPLIDIGIGKIWKKVINSKKTEFVDMESYQPSNNNPAMFVGTPLIRHGKFRAVLVLQISDNHIQTIMNQRRGYSKTQEDILVGKDKLLRSDSYLHKKYNIINSFKNPSKYKIDTFSVNEAIKGNKGIGFSTDYSKDSVISSYDSLKIGNDINWAIVSKVKEEEVLSSFDSLIQQIIIITIFLIVITSLIAIYVLNIIIIKPLKTFQDGLIGFFDYLSKNSNSVKELNNKSTDEIGVMSKAVNENIKLIQTRLEKEQIELEIERKFIQQVSTNLKELSHGNLKDRIVSDYSGDFIGIKDSINELASKVENIIIDINYMSNQHDLGDIDVVIPSNNYQGDFNIMAIAINDMVNGHITVKKLAMGVFESFGKGDFDAPLDKLPGKKVFINEIVESVRANLKALISNFEEVSKELKDGNLKQRAKSDKLDGGFKDIINIVNDTVDDFDNAFNDIKKAMVELESGNLLYRMTNDYQGDYNDMKTSINNVNSKLQSVIIETNNSTSQIAQASQNVNKTAQNLSAGAIQQASSLQETT
ncbi:MAG: hypothetical protein U9Q30_08240, partial [Campylobacterota bacterium]|nr:hypothetical protein [Campylobacterota bacterium]